MNSPTLIPFDCGDEEIGFMVRNALQNLRRLADDIFDQANERMNKCQTRLDSYKNRLILVEQKFDLMQKSEEVPLITSPAEFPGKVNLSRPLAFRPLNISAIQQETIKQDQSFKPLSIKEMVLRKNGYRFIFPKGKYNELLITKKSQVLKSTKKKKGFIRPEDFYNLKLTSSNDILFSSNSDFATNSLLIYESMKTIDSTDPFTYKPGMANLTEFDLPDVLPQLKGVTKNAYAQKQSMFGDSDDEDHDIFGEVTKRPLDVDLSARSSFYMHNEDVSRRSTISKVSIKPLDVPLIPSSPVPTQLTSIIPTPPIIEQNEIVSTVIEPLIQAPIAAPRTSGLPPPPPPMPVNLLVSIPSPPMPGRADLMEAIRLAGGAGKAKLRKAESSGNEEQLVSKPTPKFADSSDDLMGSLAKALERRRKGISGKTAKKFEALEKPQKSTGNSALSSIRELLPPPPIKNDSDSESGNEDDWK